MPITLKLATEQVPGRAIRPGDTIIDKRGIARRVDAFDPVRGALAGFFGSARVGYTREDGIWRPAGVFAADDQVTVTLPRPPRHTISIEAATPELVGELATISDGGVNLLAVSLLVVERVAGKLVRICATDQDPLPDGVTIADVARAYSTHCGSGPADDPSASDGIPEITEIRADLADRRHTITVERVDRETAYHWTPPRGGSREDLIGRQAVVERHNGRLAKVCAVQGLNGLTTGPMDRAAQATARTYGAEYVEAVR